MPLIDFPATPKQREFILSRAFIVFFMGPRGEGKTTTGLMATFAHALEHPASTWPIRWAVIRDTWENLKITTLESIRLQVRKYKIAAEGLEKLEPKVVKLGSVSHSGQFMPLVELHFFGLDQPQDANRLQGFEGAGAWIEEPAPAADMSSGVPEEALLAVTSLRQGSMEGVRPRVQITMNPPDETHWTVKYRDDEDTVEMMRAKGIEIAFIEIPAGENPGISAEYRAKNRAVLEAMGRFDLIARLVEGRVGYVQIGIPVTPEFNPNLHVSTVSLPILRRVPILRSWDFGLNPTTVFWQITPLGRIHVFYSVRSDHQGCEQHIRDAVIPWMAAKGIMKYDFWDAGDPNGMSPEARDSTVSAVTAIEEMLTASPGVPASFEPGPIPIPDRVGPIRYCLRRTTTKGLTMVQIDPEAKAMIRALSGGWHRKKDASGITRDIVKDEHSEHGDAWGYGMGLKFPIPQLVQRPRRRRSVLVPNMSGARSPHAWMTT